MNNFISGLEQQTQVDSLMMGSNTQNAGVNESHPIAFTNARKFLVAVALSAGLFNAETAVAQSGDPGSASSSNGDTPGMAAYKANCAKEELQGVYAQKAVYKKITKHSKKNKLEIISGVTVPSNCDTDGQLSFDPNGLLDVGDREFYVYGQIKNPKTHKWVNSSKKIHLIEDEVSAAGRIDKTVKTKLCKPNLKYRGVVEIKWVPHDGSPTSSRKYLTKSKIC